MSWCLWAREHHARVTRALACSTERGCGPGWIRWITASRVSVHGYRNSRRDRAELRAKLDVTLGEMRRAAKWIIHPNWRVNSRPYRIGEMANRRKDNRVARMLSVITQTAMTVLGTLRRTSPAGPHHRLLEIDYRCYYLIRHAATIEVF